MPAYVTLPGTSGNYFNTLDVNVLESDDAHFHQSIGNWTAGAGASTLAQDTSGTPLPRIGDGTAKATTDGTGAVIASLTTPTLTAVEHTVGIDIYTDTADREAFITLDGTDGTVTALTAGTWTRLTATKTVTAGSKTVTVTYRQTDNSDPAASEEVWLDQAVLRTGSDGEFVRSLRIVGDLEFEAKLALDDWTSGSTQTILDHWAFGVGGFRISIGGTGEITLQGDGAVGSISEANTASGVVDGEPSVIRVTTTTAGLVTYYVDGVQINTDTYTAQAWAPSSVGYWIGALDSDAQHCAGDFYYVLVRDGISGPVVARFDADDWVGV